MTPLEKLETIPRLTLAFAPTPVTELARLRAFLGPGAPKLFLKHDDYTGPGFGGNKVRKLEYVLSEAIRAEADTVVTCGGIRSNHCRITAALCAGIGLRCELVLNTPQGAPEDTASLWLDHLYGATVHRVSSREERGAAMAQAAEFLRRQGRKPFVVPLGASTPSGALGFVRAIAELRQQTPALDWIFHSTSSGGTQAGIDAGLQLHGLNQVKLTGVSADDSAESISSAVMEIRQGVGEHVGAVLGGPVEVDDSFVGPGYGLSTPECEEAIRLLARHEGVVLDPVYTGKAMACLLARVRAGSFKPNETVLFWHTGGAMGHFRAPAA
ncbi:MAG: D-cysteine desulfhydrase family protein [Bryobacteraceae bacterium]|nr:D-cysteine desulfhydrase family protein [Bryobacteraceae bacterium]